MKTPSINPKKQWKHCAEFSSTSRNNKGDISSNAGWEEREERQKNIPCLKLKKKSRMNRILDFITGIRLFVRLFAGVHTKTSAVCGWRLCCLSFFLFGSVCLHPAASSPLSDCRHSRLSFIRLLIFHAHFHSVLRVLPLCFRYAVWRFSFTSLSVHSIIQQYDAMNRRQAHFCLSLMLYYRFFLLS